MVTHCSTSVQESNMHTHVSIHIYLARFTLALKVAIL